MARGPHGAMKDTACIGQDHNMHYMYGKDIVRISFNMLMYTDTHCGHKAHASTQRCDFGWLDVVKQQPSYTHTQRKLLSVHQGMLAGCCQHYSYHTQQPCFPLH